MVFIILEGAPKIFSKFVVFLMTSLTKFLIHSWYQTSLQRPCMRTEPGQYCIESW